MNIPEATVRAIEEEIASDSSPVGIDAKKTHVMIIHQLREIEERLARIRGASERLVTTLSPLTPSRWPPPS